MSKIQGIQPTGIPARSLAHRIGLIVAFGVAYWLSTRLGLLFVSQAEGIAVVWPASGILFAALLLSKRRVWPAILLLAFLINVALNLIADYPLAIAIGFATVECVEGTFATWLLSRFSKTQITLTRLRDVVGVVGVAVFIADGLTALLAATLLKLSFGGSFWAGWATWWLSAGMGMLLVAPAILVWATADRTESKRLSPYYIFEGVVLSTALIAVAYVIFAAAPEMGSFVLSLPYATFPFLLWAALRFGPRGATTATLSLSIIAIWSTLLRRGPFAFTSQTISEEILAVQAFLGVGALTALVVAAAIAERRRIEESLRGSEEKLRRFVEASYDGIVLVNEQGNVIAWNESEEQITGIPRAEALGQPIWVVQSWSATPEEQASNLEQREETIRGALQTGEAPWLNRIGERELRHRDGTRRLIQASVFPIAVEKGRMLGSVSRDITEHKQFEEVLQKSEERFRAIFEGANIGMSVADSDGRLLAANPALAHLIGWSVDELIGASFVEFTYPSDVEEDIRLKGRLQAGDINSYQLDKRYIHKDGHIVWVHLSVSRFPGDPLQGPSTIAMIEDITERKKVEEALHESEARYRSIVETTTEWIWEVDLDGRHTYSNLGLTAILGYRPEEFIGLTDASFLHAEDRAEVETRRPRLIAEKRGWREWILRWRHKDGSYRFLESNADPILDSTGHILGYRGSDRDITERKQIEEALQRRAAQLAILNDVGQQIAAVLELDTVLNRATRLIEENFGYHHVAIFIVDRKQRKAVMKAKAGSFAEIFPPEHSLKLGQGMVGWVAQKGKRLLANDVLTEPRFVNFYADTIPTRCELDVPIRIGKEIVGVLDIQSPTPNDFDENDVVAMETLAGQIAAAIDNARLYESIQQELTERKRTEETLQLYAARLKTLREIDQAILTAETPQAIAQAALSRLRRLVSCERAAIVTFDFESQQAEYLATQVNGETRLGPGVRISLETFQVEKLRQREVQAEEDISASAERLPTHQILLEEGIRSYATVPLLSQGELVGALNLGSNQPHTFTPEQLEIVREVADQLAVGIQQAHLHEQVQRHANELEQRVAERTAELSTANEQLQALSYIKDVFVSNVSHELRTPIASLKLYLHLLNLRPEKRVSYIASIKREVERLEVLIEGLLMLSRLDQNHIEIDLSPLDLNRLVRDYATDRTPLAESRKLALVLDLKAKLPALKGDQGLLGQVLSILLTNAFNYTPEGGQVTVSTVIDKADAPQWIGFCVADSGPGISPEERSHLFERFYRGKAARVSGTPGTGLGLAIAKEIVDRHQGRIEVQSDGVPGHGAKFHVWLPAKPSDDSRVIG